MSPQERGWLSRLLLLSWGALGFLLLRDEMQGYEWPAIQVGPFLEGISDPGYLSTDFYQRTVRAPNPAWIFNGLVLALTRVTGLAWHAALTLIQLVLRASIPALFLIDVMRIRARP